MTEQILYPKCNRIHHFASFWKTIFWGVGMYAPHLATEHGPQISENWQRTIRATVSQLHLALIEIRTHNFSGVRHCLHRWFWIQLPYDHIFERWKSRPIPPLYRNYKLTPPVCQSSSHVKQNLHLKMITCIFLYPNKIFRVGSGRYTGNHYGFHSFPVVDWFCLFI